MGVANARVGSKDGAQPAHEELRNLLQERENNLEEIVGLVGCTNRASLLEAVKLAVVDRGQIHGLENDVAHLQRECSRLQVRNRKCKALVEESQARATPSAKALVKVKESLNVPTDITNKAPLFDAKLDQKDHLSKSRIIRFLVDQAHNMDNALNQVQVLIANMVTSSPQVTTEGTQTLEFHPEAIPDMTPTRMGRNSEATPDSQKEKALVEGREDREDSPL